MNHQRISRELLQKKDQIASIALKLIYKNQPILTNKFQNPDSSQSLRDLKKLRDYLAEAVQNNSPELFIDYIDWVRIILNNIVMNDTDIKENIENLQKAVREELATTELDDFFQMSVKRLKHPANKPTSFFYKDNPLRNIADKYLSYLLQGNRQQASQLILQAVEQGESVKDIYLEVFESVQKGIGRLWQLNELM
ncbi:MAG: B12-binding domain-containing protein [Candidatus Cloacimonadota bacterium]|nr:B12-binding domain-containing protein [Candidatus Cloacimonadota bacterium]